MKLNNKALNLFLIFIVFLSVRSTLRSFSIFTESIDTYQTSEQWKYYASLTGFILSSLLFLVLITALMFKYFAKKV